MSARLFLIFPWDVPFLQNLQKTVCTLTQGQPGHGVIIVPHNRPRRYLTEFFRQDATLRRPALLPRMLTVSEMIGLFRAQTTHVPLHTANTLDRVALLYASVQDVARQHADAELCQRFAGMDMARFFPWGLRLAAVMEECLTQQLEAQDIAYTEGEVSPLASALLGALGRIQERYLALLHERRWTTPGLDASTAARSLSDGADVPLLLRPGAARQVFIAGLAVLSNAENALLRRLWQDGAHICLHTDPALAEPSNTSLECHWACADHVRWIREWRAPRRLACPPSGRAPRLSFTAGYDAHSQLAAVREALTGPEATPAAGQQLPSTAIVLTDAGLLMPTLHHLPDQDFNVSMGYPLDRSPLCRLLEAILRMHATRRPGGSSADAEHQVADAPGAANVCMPCAQSPDQFPDQFATQLPVPPPVQSAQPPDHPDQPPRLRSRYHWRALLQCLRHPYLHMLGAPEDAPGAPSLRDVLHPLEEALRGGSRFADPYALLEAADVEDKIPPSLRPVLHDTLRCVVDNFAAAQCPQDMAHAMGDLCDLLLRYGGDTWKRYPLDAESLYRLVQGVIPELKGSALAQTPFPQAALFSLTRQLLRAQRVPFEADPIAGLQILGMLETRLLHFERLLVVDATDDALPGFTAQDPLLPDALRGLLGLPDARRRERTAAHTLYRLMAGAAEVHFFWQEGIQRSALFDGKKSRSRFVDECIWQEEKRRKTLLATGTPPLSVTPCPVHPMPRAPRGLPGDAALSGKMRALLDAGISPTRMDAYITCPARFAWEHLYGLRPLEEVNEGDDPAAVGQLIHEALCAAYTPWLHRPLRSGDMTAAQLGAHFLEMLEKSPLRGHLPPDSYIMLATAGPLRLARYLEKQPELTCVVALETVLRAPLDEGRFSLRGTLDRVDRRDGRLVVLDYKTGQVRRPAPDIWNDTAFWRDVQLWTPQSAADPLPMLAERLPSVQLPFYMHLCAHAELDTAPGAAQTPVADAAWVHLRDSGEEVPLLGADMDDDLRQTVLTLRIPQLLSFVLRHMESASAFPAREGGHCAWCPYTGLCLK